MLCIIYQLIFCVHKNIEREICFFFLDFAQDDKNNMIPTEI